MVERKAFEIAWNTTLQSLEEFKKKEDITEVVRHKGKLSGILQLAYMLDIISKEELDQYYEIVYPQTKK